MWLHPVYARAYYVPLLFIALFWGWRAGLAGAFVANILYAPHVLRAWAGEHEEYMVSQIIEMVMFFVVAGIAGFLADHERGQRREIEETATQLTKLNRQLQESFEQLRRSERLSALGELAAGLAHEIRNPLGSFEGALRIVSRPELSEGTRQEFRDLAQGEVERLKGLVSSFLDFARPPASRPSPTSPLQLLQSVERLISETASLARVTVRTEAEVTLPDVTLDSQQIKQVLLNLALNGIQAMPAGGSLVFRALLDRGAVVFEVQDAGVGVPEEDMERIFNPFFTTRASGTGLGLSISYRIVRQHGGQIRPRRNPERGMTFALEFPVEYAHVTSSTSANYMRAVPASGLRHASEREPGVLG
jgi:signal transduction histidine kinase